jgi:hypothetical protein
MFGADKTPFRIKPPRLIADATTQAAGNNVYAGALQEGATKARVTKPQGFSSGANQSYQAAMQQAAGAASGAQQRAAIEAEDQSFNANQRFDNQMLQQGARAFDYGQMTDANDAMFGYQFNNQSNRASIAMARQQAAMNLRLAMLGRGLV